MKAKDTRESQEDDGYDFYLDPNRIRTDAEVEIFADVFQISTDEVKRILKESDRKCQS